MLEDLTWTDLLTFGSGVIAALLAFLASQTKAKAEKESTLPSGWQALNEDIQEFYEKQLEVSELAYAKKRALVDEYRAYLRYLDKVLEEEGVRTRAMSFEEWRAANL